MSDFELHTHYFVSGPRNKSGIGKDGKWHVGGEQIQHSHEDGSVPHTHPHTGPSSYGHRTPKVTKRPTGEQLALIPQSEEESTFELIITDSALLSTVNGLVPIGNHPIEQMSSPAAERMMASSRLKCIVRDERRKSPSGDAA